MGLLDYMKCMDSADPTQALDQVAEDIQFVLVLPGNTVRGGSRQDFAGYIAGRNPSERVHNVVTHHRDGDVELVYGIVTEQGRSTGAFVSAARLDQDGRIVRYHSSFDTELLVAELPGTGQPG